MSVNNNSVLKDLNDTHHSRVQTHAQGEALMEVNSSVTSSTSGKFEMGFTDVVLLALVVFLANVAFKLLEKSLDWIIGVLRQKKHDTAPQEEEK